MTKVPIKDLNSAIKDLVTKEGAVTFIGAMPTSQGIFIQLFSHRYNRDYPIIITSNEFSSTVTKVYECLAALVQRRDE